MDWLGKIASHIVLRTSIKPHMTVQTMLFMPDRFQAQLGEMQTAPWHKHH